MSFKEYAEYGWVLCSIREGEKRPRGDGWNKRENGITDPARAQHLSGAGLCHAFSGTCAIDIDNVDLARVWFRERGVDLDALMKADDAVQIVRGDASHGKLLYALPEPLPTKQIKNEDKSIMIFEFRCGATTGNTAQDVLPPTIHPRGQAYAWKYNNDLVDWRSLPLLPKPLHDLWLSMIRREPATPTAREPIEGDIIVPAGYVQTVNRIQPDCDYDTWRDIGMRLHNYTNGGDAGFRVWLEWSARGDKFPGETDLRAKWDTFGRGSGPQATLEGLGAVATVEDFGPPLDQDALAMVERMAHEQKLAQFRWYTLADAMSKPSPEWIIKRVLPKRPINMMFGPSGAGKSFVALDIALAVSRGVPWREMRVEQGAVGWLAAEAEGSMRNRGHAYAKYRGLDAPPQLHILGAGIDLTNTGLIRTLAESAVPFELSLIIVDTLAAAAGSANENSGEDMNPVLDNCKLIHEITGASVLLIHHSGKDETKGSRGWSGIKARVDAQIEVKKRESSDHVRDIHIDKLRDGDEGLVMPFELHVLELGNDKDGDPITSAVVKHLSDAEVGPRKKFDKALVANERVLARDVLNRLWPLDGEPVVNIDAFVALYAEELPHTPGGKDTRHTEALNELKKLAKRGEVSIDNGRRRVTLLKTNQQVVDRLLETAPKADPDEDIL